MSQDVINDLLHIAWGLWIAYCFIAFPLWFAPVAAILPRELEQTFHAIDVMTPAGVWDHINGWDYWSGKLRDLAGFWIGGLFIHYWYH